jgi:predicted nucleic acid-binding protein
VSFFVLEHIDAAVGLRAYELLKQHAKPDGLRTFDSLIAAIALERNRTLVSKNRKHFAMIEGLRFEVPKY